MKTIIFDFDGVILDSFAVLLQEVNYLHKKYDLPHLDEEGLRKIFDKNIWDTYTELGLVGERLIAFKKDTKEALIAAEKKMPLFSGIKEIIQILAEKYNLIIVSSHSEEAIKKRLEKENMLHFFSQILGVEARGNKREKIQEILNKNKGPLLFITDTTGDVQEVKGLPLYTLGVTWGYHSKERLLTAQPDKITETPQEILNIFTGD